MASTLDTLQAAASSIKDQLDAYSSPDAKAAAIAAWKQDHPLLNPVTGMPVPGGYTGNPEHEYEVALTEKQTRYQAALAAVAAEQSKAEPNKPAGQTPDQAALTAAQVQAAKDKTGDDARLTAERANPAHPGQTNQEAIASGQAGQRLTTEAGALQLSKQTELINAQYRLDVQNGMDQQRALDNAKFAYQKVKDQLDAQVAANDKAVAAKLAEQKHQETADALAGNQRNADTSAFSSLAGADVKDFIPQGALGDFQEYMKAAADPNYKPQLTGSVASHPFNAGQVAQGQMAYAPHPVVAAMGAQIAAQVAQGVQNPPSMTAPGGAAQPAVANSIVTNSNAGGPMIVAPGPAYDPNAGFVPGG